MNGDDTTGPAPGRYLGLISGTSRDGLDLALVGLGDGPPALLSARCVPYPDALRRGVDAVIERGRRPRTGETEDLDLALGRFFAGACRTLLDEEGLAPGDVRAIGSHGQTVWHEPDGPQPVSLQLGHPGVLAEETGLPVVAHFRNADLHAGGQGAPLAPLLHRELFGAISPCAVLNLGGIANLTRLEAGDGAPGFDTGFDTGPANCLMDAWCQRHRGEAYDAGGEWAAGGELLPGLLGRLMAEPWFALPAPKSTGLEHFNLPWLEQRLEGGESPRDVQRTLLELTVASVAKAVNGAFRFEGAGSARLPLLVCGGGVHNGFLLQRLGEALPAAAVASTAAHGIDPDWVEATLFAWLARERLEGRPQDTPPITGAGRPVLLGDIFQPRAREAAS